MPAPSVVPDLPAFQNFCAFNALTLDAAWSVAPTRSQAMWRSIAEHSDGTWARRFAPLIERLVAAPLAALPASSRPRP